MAQLQVRPTTDEEFTALWWARGDAPVRVAHAVVPLIDGRAAMLGMAISFLTAKRRIWLADWDLHARLLMVRDRDQRAGPDGSPEQNTLLDRLRAAGLDDDALALWRAGQLRVMDVLGFAARRGVDVRVLLWSPFNPFGLMHIINSPREQQRLLEPLGVKVHQDKSSRSPLHVAQALHQKCAVVDDETAFVGGVDLTVEHNGDFDRWDVPAHPYDPAQRSTDIGLAPHPWHDAHLLVLGPPARDVAHNLHQRWMETEHRRLRRIYRDVTPPVRNVSLRTLVKDRRGQHEAVAYEEFVRRGDNPDEEIPGPPARVQVVRTIPPLTYRFAPDGIDGIFQAYAAAIRQARRFIHLESQYLWLEGFHGTDAWRLGWQSRAMRRVLDELAAALERGVPVSLVLPDHPNAGRAYTDQTIRWLREQAHFPDDLLRVFTLATSGPGEDGTMRYRPIYVHAKVGIVDDRWATIGSANLNSRGMSHDAEINVAVLDSNFAGGLRSALWAEHLGLLREAHTGWPAPACLPSNDAALPQRTRGLLGLIMQGALSSRGSDLVESHQGPTDEAALNDPVNGMDVLGRRAKANLDHLKRGEPLDGQLLPYIAHEDAAAFGLPVHPDCGYLDALRVQRGEQNVFHVNRYV